MKSATNRAAMAKARSIPKLCDFAGDHWTQRREGDVLLHGFAWVSDVVSDACPPLEIAQAKDGTLYLVNALSESADGVPVCQVSAEEAWRYIARRWLPPSLRSQIGGSIGQALVTAQAAKGGAK